MMLSAPTFKDKTGYLPDHNIDSEFFALNEGLKTIRKKVGEENYLALIALSDKMQAHRSRSRGQDRRRHQGTQLHS
jgi:hypothetical protein